MKQELSILIDLRNLTPVAGNLRGCNNKYTFPAIGARCEHKDRTNLMHACELATRSVYIAQHLGNTPRYRVSSALMVVMQLTSKQGTPLEKERMSIRLQIPN